MARAQYWLSLSLALGLTGCAGFDALEEPGGNSADMTNPNAGRYAFAQDRGPSSDTFRVSDVQDVEVVAEPHSRQGNSDYTLFGKRYQILASARGFVQEGQASWYGEKFHGHTTSNGETYDMYALSAAHTTLPLPTFVRVTNLENGRQVRVRVNDRGPFHENRVIDLSYAAAVRLGYADRGVTRVRIEAITPDADTAVATVSEPDVWVQFGAFSERARAARLADEVNAIVGTTPEIIETDLYRVRLGPYSEQDARTVQSDWRQSGNDEPVLVRE